MNEEIDSINRTLPDMRDWLYTEGCKALEIRRWSKSVLGKINHYQAEHQRILDEAATTLQLVAPQEIVVNNVLTFLELPSHTFELEEDDEEDGGLLPNLFEEVDDDGDY